MACLKNNEPETFDGFVDNHIYAISNWGSLETLNGFIEDHIYEVVKEESMDLVALETIYVEEQHVVYTCD